MRRCPRVCRWPLLPSLGTVPTCHVVPDAPPPGLVLRDLSPATLAVHLLAHVDRLGGDEGAGLFGHIATADPVLQEEAYVIQATQPTFERLAGLLEAAKAAMDADASRNNVYAVLALLRIFAANLQRYGQALTAGGNDLDTEAADARALFQRLQAVLMSVVEAASGNDDLAPVSRAAWTAFSVGLGACRLRRG